MKDREVFTTAQKLLNDLKETDDIRDIIAFAEFFLARFMYGYPQESIAWEAYQKEINRWDKDSLIWTIIGLCEFIHKLDAARQTPTTGDDAIEQE